MQTGLDQEHAGGASVFDLTKLVPSAAGERARIWIPDPDRISLAYFHAIGGKSAQQPGQPEPGWGGNWICQGDGETLKASTPHSDPERCVMCRMHKDGNHLVGKCKRKYIVQVFRYATDPSGTNPLTPFTMSLVVWAFSDKQYRSLIEIQNQWGAVRDRDLLLTSDLQEFSFKQWAVQALPDVMLARDPSWTDYMQQAWGSQAVAPAELERILGREPSNDQEIMAKLAEITPAAAAAPQGYAQPMAPQMPQPGAPLAPAPGLGQPGLVAPPAAQLAPANGPFDQAPQVAAPVAPVAAAPPVPQAPPVAAPPAAMPPAMPPTPAPDPQAATPMPQAPPVPAPVAPTAPPVPQAAPAPQAPAAAPVAPQAPPMAQPAPVAPPVPQAAPAAAPPAPAAPVAPPAPAAPVAPQAAPPAPPVPAAGAVPQPGQPAAAGTVDYAALLNQPPPAAPPAAPTA